MNPFSSWRIAGACIAGAALLIAGGLVFQTLSKWRADSGALAACEAAAATIAPPTLKGGCSAKISGLIIAARASSACDAGLELKEAGGFAVKAACTTPVKRLVAERDAAAGDLRDRDRQLGELLKSRSRDVAAAEARGLQQARLKANADKILNSAPLDPGGRIVCDAECLRGLAGGGVSP